MRKSKHMFGRFKINTATLICSAFVFRLLFVNIGLLSSLSSQQHSGIIKSHFSTTFKKRRNIEAANGFGTTNYAAIEICEEESDDNIQLKSFLFAPVQQLYFLVANTQQNVLKKTGLFQRPPSYIESQRYIAFQVFRI